MPFLLHVRRCPVCRWWPRTPCSKGYELFQRGARELLAEILRDPRRARA